MSFFIVKQLPVIPPNLYRENCKWDNTALLGDWVFPRALELTYTAWDMEPSPKIAATMALLSDGTRRDVFYYAASLMQLIFTCMVLSAMIWITLWRRSRL